MNTELIKKNLNENGWVIIKNFLKKKDIKKYKNIIFDFLKKNHLSFTGRHINYVGNSKTFKNIHSFHKLEACKKVKNFFYKGRLNKLSFLLFNNLKPELRASELFKKPRKFGLKAAPHQDDYYWNVKKNKGLTFWIALDPANKENGGMYYYSKSHKLGLLEHKPSYSKGTSQTVKNLKLLNNFKKIYLNLKKGDLAIHNSLVVHGSDPNKSNKNRAGWTFAVKPKSFPYDKKRTLNFVKSLNYQIQLREKKNARI